MTPPRRDQSRGAPIIFSPTFNVADEQQGSLSNRLLQQQQYNSTVSTEFNRLSEQVQRMAERLVAAETDHRPLV